MKPPLPSPAEYSFRRPSPAQGYSPRRSAATAARESRVNAGFEVLESFARERPGACFTQGEIARACGISQQRIAIIEREALKKLRGRLRLLLELQ